jgi:hypothetical protein
MDWQVAITLSSKGTATRTEERGGKDIQLSVTEMGAVLYW